jgi:3,4-dihydroxy-9,10-secoandrosta-1,3,5(10)-triene-9,17-dione 4,5-dioxygenase
VWSDGVRISFMGCNARHHSIGLMEAPANVFNHFMVELEEMDMVGRAYDLVHDYDIPIAMTLGRHWNDQVTSFYAVSPSGFNVEYGWGGRLIDRATHTTEKGSGEISFWGHRPVSPELRKALEGVR